MRRIPFIAFILALTGLASCHHTAAPSTAVVCQTAAASTTTTSTSACSDPVTGITVQITPATISVNVATSFQFAGNITGGTNTVVTWAVNNVAGGNDTVGRIDSNGLYRAPAAVPSPAIVNVTSTSFEDPKVSATAAVTIIPPPSVQISPTTATLTSGTANTKQFTGTVTGAATTNVDWQVNGVLGGNSTLGTIDSTGRYTAPLTPPIGGSATVTAVSRDFPTASASATVTISGFSTSSFQGRFAFTISGKNASGAFFRAGSFSTTGNGVLSVTEDVNGDACAVANPLAFLGTYTIAADGRGTIVFNDNCTPSTFSFVLVNKNQLQIAGFDATGTAAGQANLQDASTFRASALLGTFVFDFTGVHGPNTLSQIGEFVGDGLGNISGGVMDISDGGVASPQVSITGGSYSVNSNGRGTLILITSSGTLHFAFYIVSSGSAKFVETTETTQAVAGSTTQQSPNAIFNLTSVSGNLAFLLSGSRLAFPIGTAGSFTADGNGHLTPGVVDENVNSAPVANFPFLAPGTYTVASNGRGTAAFSTASRSYTLVFYLSGTGNGVLQETDLGTTSDGLLVQQQSTPFSLASVQGTYAIGSNGFSGASAQVITGELKADGAGTIPSGALDINTAGVLIPGQAVTGAYTLPSANGRATLTLSPTGNFAIYVVNSTQVLVLELDAGRVQAGNLFRQF